MSKLFNTLIVEDDQETIKSLVRELKIYDKIIKISVIAKTYAEARTALLMNSFDLSILDKGLDEGYTCFDLIENSNISNFGIIALNSKDPEIKLDVLALFKTLPTYINKPYTHNTVGDFIKRLNEIKIEEINNKILLNAGHDGDILIDEESIVYIESQGGYSTYHFSIPYDNKMKITISESLIDQEGKLNKRYFLRVHKSFIVNLSKFIKFQKGDTRTSGKLKLEGNHEVDYALTNHNKIMEMLKTI